MLIARVTVRREEDGKVRIHVGLPQGCNGFGFALFEEEIGPALDRLKDVAKQIPYGDAKERTFSLEIMGKGVPILREDW